MLFEVTAGRAEDGAYSYRKRYRYVLTSILLIGIRHLPLAMTQHLLRFPRARKSLEGLKGKLGQRWVKGVVLPILTFTGYGPAR